MRNAAEYVTLSLQVITGMPAYQIKSLEELRLEDYQRGKKNDNNDSKGVIQLGIAASDTDDAIEGVGATSICDGDPTSNSSDEKSIFGFSTPSCSTLGISQTSPFGAIAPTPLRVPSNHPCGTWSGSTFSLSPFNSPVIVATAAADSTKVEKCKVS